MYLAVVREERGPYSDPQHPYFYEEEDVWMAPGFINQFYEVSSVSANTCIICLIMQETVDAICD